MKIKVSCAMPRSYRAEREQENLKTALAYADKAAREGANILTFPEGFPGPYNGEYNWEPEEALCKKSRELGLYIIYGTLDQAETEQEDRYYLTTKVAGPGGDIVGKYYRMQPNQSAVDDVLMNNKKIRRGEEFCLIETEYGNLGLLICSEIWCPELVRILALSGADIVFAPIGGLVYELMSAWKCLLWARAIENHLYVVTTQNLYGMEEGICMITGPESVLAERSDEGLITAELDLSRLEWLRQHDQSLELPKQYKSIPGLLNYRRPEKYGKLVDLTIARYDF